MHSLDNGEFFKDNSCDYYTISFGLRNTKDLNKALSEAYRVLKPGGRYLCLEFSKIQNSNLDFIYKNYSKLIPLVGKAIVGQKEPYEYLIKSIEEFINQEELIDLMNKKTNSGLKIICLNRKASFNYFFEDLLEAGIVLKGSEIKSIRDGKIKIKTNKFKKELRSNFIH